VRVLVTGTSGGLGGEVAGALARAGIEVLGVDARPGPRTTVVADVRDARAMHRAIERSDALIHTVSLHAPDLKRSSVQDFISTNVVALRNALHAAAAARLSRVVFTSTTSVYGHALDPRDEAVWVDESLVPQPRDIYDVTKLAAERLCARFNRSTDVPTVSLRISRFSFSSDPGLAAAYCLHRAVDVRDAALAHLLALVRPLDGYHTFNVSGASPFKREDVAQLLRNAASVLERRAPEIVAAFRRAGRPLPHRIDRVYAIDQARRGLAYEPRYGVLDLLSPRDLSHGA
jgi:UDP-glucose 4-epimerase